MIDDEFQLPVLAARYLADSAVPADRKRGFLLDTADAGRVRLARCSARWPWCRGDPPYAERPHGQNLVSFVKRDTTHWRSASWRDSDAGYAGGRFAMDINAIWAPQALEAVGVILRSLQELGLDQDSGVLADNAPALQRYRGDSTFLHRAIDTWKGARKHFTVKLSPTRIRRALDAKLGWMPAAERTYWKGVLSEAKEPSDSLTFLALSLDAAGKPIGVVNTDPAQNCSSTPISIPGSSRRRSNRCFGRTLSGCS